MFYHHPQSARPASRNQAESAIQNDLCQQTHGQLCQQSNETLQKSKLTYHKEAIEWHCSRVCMHGSNGGYSILQIGGRSISSPFPPDIEYQPVKHGNRHYHSTTRPFLAPLYTQILDETNRSSKSTFMMTLLVPICPIHGRNPTSTRIIFR